MKTQQQLLLLFSWLHLNNASDIAQRATSFQIQLTTFFSLSLSSNTSKYIFFLLKSPKPPVYIIVGTSEREREREISLIRESLIPDLDRKSPSSRYRPTIQSIYIVFNQIEKFHLRRDSPFLFTPVIQSRHLFF